ncbi:hypothetical protein FRB98_007797 [Tulasnella sp. 332]|nr:hypothetical protein FRB98_007797 [Tulasnella sp. 332]
MSETILVSIQRPTALENKTVQSISVPGQDLWLNAVTNVHIIPTKVNVERFKAAVARAAARYPPVAGRLIREGDEWRASDAKAMLDFTLALSALYEDLDAPESNLPLAPSFYRHVYPHPYSPSCPSLSDGYLWRMPHLAQDYQLSKLMGVYSKGEESTELLRLRFTAKSMERMFAALGPHGTEENELKLNVHDAFTAYLVAALNKSLENPVRRVINIVGYRAPPKFVKNLTSFAPWAHPAAQGNGMLAMISDPLAEADLQELLPIARHIRAHINLARDPEFLERFFTLGSFFMAKSANAGQEGRYHCFMPDEGDTTLNSKSRFHTAWTTKNYFRIFIANPPSGGDTPSKGTPQDADVSFLILSAFKEKFISIVKHDHEDVIVDDGGYHPKVAEGESKEGPQLYH